MPGKSRVAVYTSAVHDFRECPTLNSSLSSIVLARDDFPAPVFPYKMMILWSSSIYTLFTYSSPFISSSIIIGCSG